MNKPPSPSLEAAGLRAYEQARAFEAIQARRLPLIYFGVGFGLLLCAGGALAAGYALICILCVATAIIFGYCAWFHWRMLQARHSSNLQLLAEMEARFGDQLPWLKVERHLTDLEKLKAEIEREKSGEENS